MKKIVLGLALIATAAFGIFFWASETEAGCCVPADASAPCRQVNNSNECAVAVSAFYVADDCSSVSLAGGTRTCAVITTETCCLPSSPSDPCTPSPARPRDCVGGAANFRHGNCSSFEAAGSCTSAAAGGGSAGGGTQCCIPPTSGPLCTTGASCPVSFTPDSRTCEAIPGCPQYVPPTTTTTTAGSGVIEFPNPLNYNSVTEVLYAFLRNLQGIIVTLAIIFIVLAGVMYMLAAGNENRITLAKRMFTGAIIGFAIALAAPTFLKEIRDILGGTTAGDPDAWVDTALGLKEILLRILSLLLSLIGTLGIISLVIAGIMYLTASGDEKRIDTAKKMTTYAIIGIVVAFGALVVVRQVAALIT